MHAEPIEIGTVCDAAGGCHFPGKLDGRSCVPGAGKVSD